ncbi:MAG: ADP-ribosylglycohydrolase family protein [Spirochaetales bacterium]|nr:ADP-ribosylglycohydrolase family protein [Spirochaetales bacterium]MCF7937698.1 ADP-ribosylglycohydrolase family protein [Spirochaetales bacterium]
MNERGMDAKKDAGGSSRKLKIDGVSLSPKKAAWEIELETLQASRPPEGQAEDRSWELMGRLESFQDGLASMLWRSKVPGSGAPEHLLVAGVQALENRGYRVDPEWRKIAEEGFKALESDDSIELQRQALRMRALWRRAEKDPDSGYWRFRHYTSWEEVRRDMDFSAAADFAAAASSNGAKASAEGTPASGGPLSPAGPRKEALPEDEYLERVYAGWLAQIIGGAHGTALEGYTTDRLHEAFGEVHSYVYPPSTLNDDITFELAFLLAVEEAGGGGETGQSAEAGTAKGLTSRAIGEQWAARIPFGWSAELIALENLKAGLTPPESAQAGNPFTDWIGAQMRGAVCGLVAPAEPETAAWLAWVDGRVSHADNGVLGEVFNALIVSLAFGGSTADEETVRQIVRTSIAMIPEKSEYRSVLEFALRQCRNANDWETAWRACEYEYRRYNWVHAYPNAAAEVVALWFGGGDFGKTLEIISMEGQDVDCNAAQIMTVIGVLGGENVIPPPWREPIGDRLETYVRGMKEIGIHELSEWTVKISRLL